MLGYYNYTVWLTYGALVSSVLGIGFAANENTFLAVVFLIISGFLDAFDGTVARTKKNRTEQEKKYGIQIDSLADVISFGVLPSMIGYSLGLKEWYFVLGLAFFTLAALIRLAYFNVSEEERQSSETCKRKYYLGLPVTNVVFFSAFVCAFARELGSALPYVYFGVLMMVALLFLLRFKMPKAGLRGMIVLIALGAVILAMIIIRRSYL